MKKLFYTFAALAVVASCAKVAEVETNVEPKEEKNMVQLTIHADELQTKTYIEQEGSTNKYQPGWNKSDDLGVFFNSWAANSPVNATLTNTANDGEAGVFSGTVSLAAGDYTIYGFHPASALAEVSPASPSINLIVPTIQYPDVVNNSFDKNADLVVSRKKENVSISESKVDIDGIVFGRILATIKVKVAATNPSLTSDLIKRVTITSGMGGASLTGTLKWNFDEEESEAVDGVNSVSADFSAAPIAMGSDFFLLTMPETLAAGSSLTVTVYTVNHKITKTIASLPKDIVFPADKMAALNIELDNSVTLENPDKVFTLLKSGDTIKAGDEVIIAAKGYNVALSTIQAENNRKEATILKDGDDLLFHSMLDDVQRFIVEDGTIDETFSFKCINGSESNKYIYAASSSKNYLRSEDAKDANASFTVVLKADDTATITAKGSNTRNLLKYNDASSIFSCYSSGQKDVAIYRSSVPSLATPANLMAEYSAGKIDVVWDAVSGADSYTVTCTGKDTQSGITGTSTSFSGITDGTYTITVTAISNDHSIKMDSEAASTIVVAGTPALGKPVISSFTETATGFDAVISAAVEYAQSYDWDLYVDSVDYNNWIGSGSTTDLSFSVTFEDIEIAEFTPGKTYLLVVTAKAAGYTDTESDPASFEAFTPSYDFTTIAELKALITSTSTEFSGKLTSAVVSFAPNNSNAIIKDASGSILYYKNGHGLKQGQVFSGELTVTTTEYKGTKEITACDAKFTGDETEVTPAVMTLDQLVGNFETYQSTYVSVSDLTVTSVDGKYVYVKNGDNTYVVYSNAGNATVKANDIITAVGTVAVYNTIDQIKVWNTTDIIKTGEYAAPKHAVTFTQPSETGCSFTVSVGGSPINSGDSVSEGATVTLNATAGAGYTFSSWTVTGATVSGNTPSATFVMGESNVTISATFEVGVEPTYATKTIDFESALDTYTDWSFTNIGTTNTAITAHGGSKYGSNINGSGNGVASAEIKTAAKYAKPYHIKFYNSKVSTNTSASSWKVEVSTDGSSWTTVETIDAKSMGKGNWVENTVALSSYSDVYVRITYSGSTAIRAIDDIELKYQTN